MNQQKFRVGDDFFLSVPITDNDGNAVLVGPALSGIASNIEVKLFVGDTNIDTFSITNGDLSYDTNLTNVVIAKVITTRSAAYPTGAVKAVISVYFNDVNFPDGNRKETYSKTVAILMPSTY